MRRKWLVKLATPILALGLVSACGAANDNNDITPEETNNTPQNQGPNNDNMRHNNQNENDPGRRHNNNMNAPNNNNDNKTSEPGVNSNDKGNGPEHGTEPTKNFSNN